MSTSSHNDIVYVSSEDDEKSSDTSDDEVETKKDKNPRIRIDRRNIECVTLDAGDELEQLGVTAYDQSKFEEAVARQIDSALDGGSGETTNVPSTSSGLPRNALTNFSVASDVIPQTRVKKALNSRKQINRDSSESEDQWQKESVDDTSESSTDVSDDDICSSDEDTKSSKKRRKNIKEKSSRKKLKEFKLDDEDEEPSITLSRHVKVKDDGDEKFFKKRLKNLKNERREEEMEFGLDSWTEMEDIGDNLSIPSKIWNKLFPHQRSCVKWLWALHNSCVGGIVGDEMGLGKTISIIAFISGLHSSKLNCLRESFKSLGPILLVCPATLMHNWVYEFHSWYPLLRVVILHSSGSSPGHTKSKRKLLRSIENRPTVIITTYATMNEYQDELITVDWHYVILDEGHKIRNPDAQTTLACKRMRTPHRIILSGSPIQNNLKELWSLMDFCVPGLLGPLPTFQESFAAPITQGGYANASDVQVKIGYRVACTLRDSIKPYLLRRTKEDVKDDIRLPSKNEQVLFCRLTEEQRKTYQSYINSPVVKDIVKGSNDMFVGLINLRKLCNHPLLFHRSSVRRNPNNPPTKKQATKSVAKIDDNEDDDLIHFEASDEFFFQSGKMRVLNSLLKLWKDQGLRVLLFSQGIQMLTILEKYLQFKDYKHLVLDGRTPISQRQCLVNTFNEDSSIFIFLLTTRVGGIGVNLTGASRVLIFDPDWNPSTDSQAKERAWRIGQDKSVTVYRLLTAGTVEEKMYQRQVFKQYLSIRILKDPKQRRFFQTSDLYDLFTLGSDETGETRSQAIFAGTGSEIQVIEKTKKKKKKLKVKKLKRTEVPEVSLSSEKILELRERAKQLSQMVAKKFQNDASLTDQLPSSSTSSNGMIAKESPNKKKKRKKSKNDLRDETIDSLVRHETLRTSDTNLDKNEKVSKKQDEYVLSKLLGGKNDNIVHALKHDVIEGTVSDYTIVEAEAEKIANDALEAVKRSRANCFSATSGIPSWTGMSGKLRTSKVRPAFGKGTCNTPSSSSSTELVKAMKSRHRLEETPSTSFNGAIDVDSIHSQLLTDLRCFLAFQSDKPGEASTNEVLAHFKDRILPHQNPVFKSFLRKLCDFTKRNGSGIWILKHEYKV